VSEPVRGDLPVVRTVLGSLAASAAQRAAAELPRDARLVHRRDEREELLAGRFVDSRTGLTPVGADPAGDPLTGFTGTGTVRDAGLGLPVVVATDPAILGEASTATTWLVRVTGLAARKSAYVRYGYPDDSPVRVRCRYGRSGVPGPGQPSASTARARGLRWFVVSPPCR